MEIFAEEFREDNKLPKGSLKKCYFELLYLVSENKINRIEPSVQDRSDKDISFCRTPMFPSIKTALRDYIPYDDNADGKQLYAYMLKNPSQTKQLVPSKVLVPQSELTGEVWIMNSADLVCIGKIIVSNSDTIHTYSYGEGDARIGKIRNWNYIWLEKMHEGLMQPGDSFVKFKAIKQKRRKFIKFDKRKKHTQLSTHNSHRVKQEDSEFLLDDITENKISNPVSDPDTEPNLLDKDYEQETNYECPHCGKDFKNWNPANPCPNCGRRSNNPGLEHVDESKISSPTSASDQDEENSQLNTDKELETNYECPHCGKDFKNWNPANPCPNCGRRSSNPEIERLEESSKSKYLKYENVEIDSDSYQDGFFHPEEIVDIVASIEDEIVLYDGVTLKEWFEYYNARCKGFTSYNEKIEKAWYNKMLVATESEKIMLGWNPYLEFNSSNRYFASKRLNEVIQQYNESVKLINATEQSYITEGTVDDFLQPVHIILSYTGSRMSNMIKKVTGDKFTHSSISFDLNMDRIFSFNGTGFVIESFDTFKKQFGNIFVGVYTVFLPKVSVRSIKLKLDEIMGRASDFVYNKIGLLGVLINKPLSGNDRLFCSEFVDTLLKMGDSGIKGKESGLVKPQDFANQKNIYKVYEGNIDDYKKQKCISIVNKLKKTDEKQYDMSTVIKNGGFMYNDRWNSIVTLDEYPGKVFRHRVEILVIDNGKVFVWKHNNNYSIPGGSTEKDIIDIEQVQNEAKEEARLLCKDVRFTGLSYVSLYAGNREWMNKLPVKWQGTLNDIYIGQYNGKYKGPIDTKDIDNAMTTYGKFYKISDVELKPEHQQAINMYLNGQIQESVLEATLPIDFDKDGSLIIKNPKIDYHKEYLRSHRILKNYDKSENIQGMKFELARLWYLNYKLEGKIYGKKIKERKEFVDLRARILNDFNKYLRLVNSKENDFNFSEYFNSTIYNTGEVKISKNLLYNITDYAKHIMKI